MRMRNLMRTRMLLAAALLICGANALAQGPPAGGRGELGIAPLKDFLDLSDEQVRKLQENQNALREAVRSAVEETTRKHREQALVVLSEEQKERLESMQSALRQRQAGRAALGAAALNLIEPGDIRSGFGGAPSRGGFRRGGGAGGPGGRSGIRGRGFGGRRGFGGSTRGGRSGFRGRGSRPGSRFQGRRPDGPNRGRPRGPQSGDQAQ